MYSLTYRRMFTSLVWTDDGMVFKFLYERMIDNHWYIQTYIWGKCPRDLLNDPAAIGTIDYDLNLSPWCWVSGTAVHCFQLYSFFLCSHSYSVKAAGQCSQPHCATLSLGVFLDALPLLFALWTKFYSVEYVQMVMHYLAHLMYRCRKWQHCQLSTFVNFASSTWKVPNVLNDIWWENS